MRRFAIVFSVLTLVLGGVSVIAYAADCMKDTAADRAGDWLATLGKTGLEKDQVLSARKAGRMGACAQKMAKEAADAASKAGNDMKKKLGF